MSKLTVYDMNGASVGDLDIADELLQTGKGQQAVHDVVVAHMAKKRAGSASTLTKGEVAGTGAKPWKQKGTGRARAGYRQSPVWRGGAVAFGPRPRDYGKKVNRKVAKLALQSAFAAQVESGVLKVVDQFSLEEPRTKQFVAMMKSLEVATPALFITDQIDRNLALAARNIPRVEVVSGQDVNVYQLLRYRSIIATKSGMAQIANRLGAQMEGDA